jgi:hypothetical protein
MRIRNNVGAILGLVALTISCGVGSIVGYDHVKDYLGPDNYSRPASAAEVEANAKVRLPAGTTLLLGIYESSGRGLDFRVIAEFRFARAALPRFIADSALPEPQPGAREVTDMDLPNSDTWRPDAATAVAGIDGNQPYQGIHRHVMLDLSNQQDVTVYLDAGS